MFCAICAPQIEREIAMCWWRVSVINLVCKQEDAEGKNMERVRCVHRFHTFSVTTHLRNNEKPQ